MLVVSDMQTKGRGQMGNHWLSESGKNLTFSMFIELNKLSIDRQFQLNQAVSLGLLFALKKYLPKVQIKWPNDIMADTKKIAGMLIENTVSSSIIKHSVIGIGLNVNQTEFPKELTQAISLKIALNRDFDLDSLLIEISHSIIRQILLLDELSVDKLHKMYLENLYLLEKEAQFLDGNKKKFTGKIVGLSLEGNLLVRLKNAKIKKFGFKEIEFVY